MQYNAGTSNGSANSEAHIYLLDTAGKYEHLLATNSAATWQPSAIKFLCAKIVLRVLMQSIVLVLFDLEVEKQSFILWVYNVWTDAWLDLSVFTQANKAKFQNKTHTDLTEGKFIVDIDLLKGEDLEVAGSSVMKY